MGRMYASIRVELDDEKLRDIKWKRLKISRGGKPKMPDPPQESQYNRGDYRNLTTEEVKAWRKNYIDDFPNTDPNLIKNYSGINQGSEGACSFVAFLNMIHLTGRDALFNGKQWEDKKQGRKKIKGVKNSWQTLWKKLQICEAAEDIADMLDRVNKAKIMDNFNLSLGYFPIRSRNNGENNFNIKIAGTNQNDTALNVQKKIEGLLKQGIPVEINFAEHSRVAVGYNETHLLFADSWEDNYYEQSADKRDTNAAGFSTVEKDVVYAYAREIAYFYKKNELEEAMKNFKIVNVEETSTNASPNLKF